MLGHVMSIIIFLLGIFEGIFNEKGGFFLSGAMIIYWIVSAIWDKSNHNDSFKDWKELKILIFGEKNKNEH